MSHFQLARILQKALQLAHTEHDTVTHPDAIVVTVLPKRAPKITLLNPKGWVLPEATPIS